MEVLRPDLYKRLRDRFGMVLIAHEGEAFSSSVEYDTISQRHRLNIHNRGEAYRVNCPFCNDTRHRLHINHMWGAYDKKTNSRNLWLCHCFNERCHETYERQLALYNDVYDDKPPRHDIVRRGVKVSTSLHEAQVPGLIIPLHELPPHHHANVYMRMRGFDPTEMSVDFGMCYCQSAEPQYRLAEDRIYIPMYMKGMYVGWQCRLIRGTASRFTPKYYTFPTMKKTAMLYSYDVAKRYPYVVICEGPLSARKYGPEAVALLGKTMSSIQQRYVVTGWETVVILLDGSAIDEAQGVYDLVHNKDKVKHTVMVRLPEGTDPGDFDTQYVRDIVAIEAAKQGVELGNMSEVA